jgi:uncharacterized protein
MPLYALVCRDKPGTGALRAAKREAHLGYIASTGVVTLAGPFVGEDGAMNGSLIVLEVAGMAEAQAWAAADPYALVGLFDSVAISGWRRVIG